MRVAAVYRLMTASCAITALGCSSNGGTTEFDDADCIRIQGSAQLTGNRAELAGNGVFRFDDEDRPVEVGLYLREMREVPDGMFVDTQYQFHWDNGDSFVTRDEAFFQPGFEADQYTFNTELLVVAGTGVFADQVGKKTLALTAIIEFGPPPNPGDPQTADQSFDIGGSLCPG